ncbi:MAG: pyruvate dehydrogenase complex dihydrolipoamide acetyltransferase [Verrucomicrobia bacterium]|nr:MAG: pyruvate dehydrogenase complex dihydrolipoamide acetyltransferase [Verrucomicrobiota bacterium]
MATIIEMPKLSDTMTAGTLVNWLKEEGETVSNGDMIAEIETDKATMELEVFDDGILLKQFVAAGDQVDIGTPIAAIGDEGETVEAPAPVVVKEVPPKAQDQEATRDETNRPTAPADIPAPAPGSIKQQPAPTAPPDSDAPARIRISPLARRLAEEKGVDLAQIQGTGPGGRILKADVLAAAGGDAPALPQAAPKTSSTPAQSRPVAIAAGAPIAEDADIPLSNMRGIIASRLVESKTTVPHFYLEIEIDAGPLMRLRAELNANLAELPPEQGGIKFTVTDFILKGSAEALRRVPQVNASWMGDRVRQHGAVHLSLAIAVPDGLVTPKIENAHSKTLRQVAVEARDLAARARDKKLRPDEFTGSTFTISSLGMLGIDSFFAIINPPNAAILSVGAILKKPVVNERDEVVPGQRMKIGMSCDHRVVDGATGAQYLAALKTILETPALMLV